MNYFEVINTLLRILFFRCRYSLNKTASNQVYHFSFNRQKTPALPLFEYHYKNNSLATACAKNTNTRIVFILYTSIKASNIIQSYPRSLKRKFNSLLPDTKPLTRSHFAPRLNLYNNIYFCYVMLKFTH